MIHLRNIKPGQHYITYDTDDGDWGLWQRLDANGNDRFLVTWTGRVTEDNNESGGWANGDRYEAWTIEPEQADQLIMLAAHLPLDRFQTACTKISQEQSQW